MRIVKSYWNCILSLGLHPRHIWLHWFLPINDHMGTFTVPFWRNKWRCRKSAIGPAKCHTASYQLSWNSHPGLWESKGPYFLYLYSSYSKIKISMKFLLCTRNSHGIWGYLMSQMSALDVVFLLLTKELLISERGHFRFEGIHSYSSTISILKSLKEYRHTTLT